MDRHEKGNGRSIRSTKGVKNAKEIKITWSWEQGKKKITNVPVLINDSGERLFKGYVSLKISAIGEYMKENDLNEYDYESFTLDV